MDYELDRKENELNGYTRIGSRLYAEICRKYEGDAVRVVHYSSIDDPDMYFSIDQPHYYRMPLETYNELVNADTYFLHNKSVDGSDDTVTFFYARNEIIEKLHMRNWDARENDEVLY